MRGPDTGFLPDTPTRIKIDLSGKWKYALENGQGGTTMVPGAFDFTGRVTYERTFELTEAQIDSFRLHLVMLGVNHTCDVFINGEFLVNHQGGYSGFVQEIPRNLIQPGRENVIRVAVSNILDPRTTLPLKLPVWSWRNYGGITRDVFLLGTPHVFIRDVRVDSAPADRGSGAIVRATVTVEGRPLGSDSVAAKTGSLAVVVEAFDRISGASVGRSKVVTLKRSGNEFEPAVGEVALQEYKPWSPSTPDLYLVRSQVVALAGKEMLPVDAYDVNTGIRRLALSAGDLTLNGSRLILKGVVWVEDHPTWGSALAYEDRERDIALIKSLGANAVRFAHHSPHPYMINLCERYGLLALVELPIYQVPPAICGSEAFVDLARSAMREMVMRDRNSPAVLAWGYGQELELDDALTRQMLVSLREVALGLDRRPLYAVSLPGGGKGFSEIVDLAGVASAVTDLKAFKTELGEWRAAHRGVPVFVARFGTEVEHENRNGYGDPLSVQAQARYFLQRLDAIRNEDYDGGFVWTFNDWRGDRPSLTVSTGDPWVHTTGLVSAGREKRLAYDAVRAAYNGEKFHSLPMGSYSVGMPIVYVVLGFALLVGMAYVYNVNRRFRDNLVRSVFSSYNFFADVRDQHLVSGIQSAMLGLVVSVATAIVASSLLYHFRSSLLLDNLLSYLLVSDGLKYRAVRLIRDPLLFIPVFTALTFGLLMLLVAVILATRLLFRARVYTYHAYSVTLWSTPPLLLLIPIGMILYRVIESAIYVIPALAIIVGLLVWVAVRLLKGVAIVFDVSSAKVYALGLGLVLVMGAALYVYYDVSEALPTHIAFQYHQLMSGR